VSGTQGSKGAIQALNHVWDGTKWVEETQPGGAGGGAVTVADGADTAEGTTTDAAITGDNPGTISGKLRGLLKIITDVWDSVNHQLKVNGGGNVVVDRSAYTSGGSQEGLVAGVFDDTLPDLLVGMVGAPRLTAKRSMYTTILQPDINLNLQTPLLGSLRDLPVYSVVKGSQSGSLTAPGQSVSGSYVADSSSMGTIVITISGTWTGTLQFETPNGTPFPAVNVATGVPATTTTVNGSFMLPIVGNQSYRVLATALSSLPDGSGGTAVVAATGAVQVGSVVIGSPLPPGANVIGHVINDASGAVIGHVVVDSGTLIVTQPTGTNLHVVVDTAPSTPVTGPLTDGQLRATAVPVTANAGTNLNTSALALDATVAKDASLATIDTDIKATQPRDVTDRAARLLGHTVVDSGSITANPAFATRADIFTTAGNGGTIVQTSAPLQTYAIQVTGTNGAATSWDVRLEGSLDGVKFTQILQHTQVTGDGVVVWSGTLNSPSLYFRSRVAAVVLGLSATNIVVTILGRN
jgi:hypothetical protein